MSGYLGSDYLSSGYLATGYLASGYLAKRFPCKQFPRANSFSYKQFTLTNSSLLQFPLLSEGSLAIRWLSSEILGFPMREFLTPRISPNIYKQTGK